MDTIRAFFPKIRALSSIVKKGQRRFSSPLPLPVVANLHQNNVFLLFLGKIINEKGKVNRKSISTQAIAKRCIFKVTGKHLCQSLFLIKLLLKMGHWHRCFPVNFAKFYRAASFIEHFRWLLLHPEYLANQLKIPQVPAKYFH